jgi:hypothetical protein
MVLLQTALRLPAKLALEQLRMDMNKHEALGRRISRIDTKGFARRARFEVRRPASERIRSGELDAAPILRFYA